MKVIITYLTIIVSTILLNIQPVLASEVLSGLDHLLSSQKELKYFENKNIALITNQSGLTKNREKNYLALPKAGIKLVKIFAPEHGFKPDDTSLPVITLYGNKQYKPTPAMLKNVDILLFDIQDVGARFFTYASTMSYGMEAARENNIPFVVLDRPNPINGLTVRGKILEKEFATFVGRYPLPIQHGMTLGELAQMFNSEFKINSNLKVVKVKGWKRNQWFDQTHLPWVPPSPSMRTLTTATHYPGTCYFEGTNLSLGRGTSMPFEVIGAPWLNVDKVLSSLPNLKGVKLEKTSFTPTKSDDKKYDDELNQGIFIRILNRDQYNPIEVSLKLLEAIIKTHSSNLEWFPKHFDRLLGTREVRLGLLRGRSIQNIMNEWQNELNQFKRTRQKYLLYKSHIIR